MFLPICKQDLIERNIDQLDFIYVSGDAYVDHPSFGHAIISRLIEYYGYTVGIIAQPQTNEDYKKLGEPRLGFFVGSGVVDSMVNNYTVALRKRSDDVYSEGGIGGKRPDRALIVYCKKIKELFPKSPLIIGGIEASLRRFSHYDYWSDSVMNSILVDTNADLLIYGMGEMPIKQIMQAADRNKPLDKIKNIFGTSYICCKQDLPSNYLMMPSHKDVCEDKKKYCKAFITQSQNTDARNASVIVQYQGDDKYVVQNIPAMPLEPKELDVVYNLPYERTYHPVYTKGIPALQEVEFSITSQRGCFGGCSFCALTYHQGRAISHRSEENIVSEAQILAANKNFKGYIHDVGGPSANFYNASCDIQKKHGVCKHRQCIGWEKCQNLKVDHSDYLSVLKNVEKIKGVKKVFVRSGIRFDYVMMDKNGEFFDKLCKDHISGQLKIAPEHISNNVLKAMNKPSKEVYFEFAKRFAAKNQKLCMKQYLVPYLISSHPCCTLNDAIELTCYLNEIGYMPQQVQDFYPTPSTKSTCMFYTGLDVDTLKPVYVAKTREEKQMQRALMQWRKNENYDIVKKALIMAKREDLIGYDKHCLIKPKNYAEIHSNHKTVSANNAKQSGQHSSANKYKKFNETSYGSKQKNGSFGRKDNSANKKEFGANGKSSYSKNSNGNGTTQKNNFSKSGFKGSNANGKTNNGKRAWK